jgi:hypothetical protein
MPIKIFCGGGLQNFSSRFSVNSNTGRITLAKELDFETRQQFGLTYIATDGGGLFTRVPFRVSVLDYNDEGPIFQVDQYDSYVNESSTKMQPDITVFVSMKKEQKW